MKIKIRTFATAAAALSLAATPVVAEASYDNAQEGGVNIVVILLGAAAVIAGIVVAADGGDDDAVSP